VRCAAPPRLANWLLERFGTTSRLHSLLGDLAEEYANGRSRGWYWRQALGTVALDSVRTLRTHAHSLSFIVTSVTGAKRRDRTREDAFAWVARVRRGLRADEASQLQEWLKRRSHRECIARLAAEGDSPETLAVLGEIFLINPEWIDAPQRRSPAINVLAALAATFISALPLIYTHHYVPGLILGPAIEGSFTETMGTVYASDRRTTRRVVLADGTHVVMNRATRMIILYINNWRSVLLTRGEATFTVARDPLRGFELAAGGHLIRTVAGTFNIHLTGKDAMELTVLEGTVTVFPAHASAAGAPVALEGGTNLPVPRQLNARQMLISEPGTESEKSLSQLQAQARIAWQG